MKRTMKYSGLAIGLGLWFVGCGGVVEPGNVGTLDVSATAGAITGSFTRAGDAVTFRAAERAADKFDIVVELHGLTLTAIVDTRRNVAEIDGFASNNGADTQVTEEDRALLGALVEVLPAKLDNERPLVSMLSRVLSQWSQTPDTVPLARSVAGSEEQGWTSICSSYYKYLKATHDCSSYGRWNARSTSYAHVGQRTSSTYYLVNGVWTTTTQNHVAYLYERGACYGNCGGGCPSGAQQLTIDCLDHDQCVRNGHALASLWCDDEFVSASDDELFAPKCSGT